MEIKDLKSHDSINPTMKMKSQQEMISSSLRVLEEHQEFSYNNS